MTSGWSGNRIGDQPGAIPGAIMADILYGEGSVAVPLLNYTTKIPAEQTAAEIMSILVRKGATEILTHSDQRWATTLKSLDSRAADEEDQAGMTGGASAALDARNCPPAQTNLPAEGEMEGDSESHAQGNVAAGYREGVRDPQSHHQEIHGCRWSSGAAVPACSHCVNIRYSGAITK